MNNDDQMLTFRLQILFINIYLYTLNYGHGHSLERTLNFKAFH